MAYGIRLLVSGDYACFTRPEMKVERVSYDVMTPSAARGILEAIHWKPAIRWVIDAIHVLKPIRFQSIRRNEVGHKAPAGKIKTAFKRGSLEGLHLLVDEDRQQRAATVLADVTYVIEAHFEMTDKAGADDNVGKHLDIFNRRAARGQCFHQPCLGNREFAAHFELLPADVPLPPPIGESRDLGFMLWDIDHGTKGRPSLFFRARLDAGVLRIPAPDSPEIRRWRMQEQPELPRTDPRPGFAGDPPMSILASLAKAYERLPEKPALGFSIEKVGFVISLNADGSVANVSDLRMVEGKKTRPRLLQVPQPAKKSVNISPNFLWGNTAYVLGVTDNAEKNPSRLANEHAAFVELHLNLLQDEEDPGLLALRLFLKSWTPNRFSQPHWPDEMRDQNIVFALESERRRGVFIHDSAAAKAVWEKKLSAAGDRVPAVCLVSGETRPAARLHPAIKGVRDAQSSGASIVSFNLDAFESYGHEQGANAPVSEEVAFAYTTALNTFLAKDSGHRIQIGDASTAYWADASNVETGAEAESLFGAFFNDFDEETEAKKIGAKLERIRRGQPLRDVEPKLADDVRFCVLGLAPNAARLSIRFWLDDDFANIAANYQRFVADMAIEPPPRDPYPALWKYLQETAVLRKNDNIPPNLAGAWMRAILTGTPYPLTLLATVLMRIRADKDVNALRVGMLKAVLIRNFAMNEETPVALDLDNINKGYLLGRLFAAYEQAQSAALGPKVNATIKDKFYGAASAQPRKVFALLDKGSANHLSKVGKDKPGYRVVLEKTIGAIMEQMSPGEDPFPASLSAQEQALFGLGYYHQRNELFRKKDNNTDHQDNQEFSKQ